MCWDALAGAGLGPPVWVLGGDGAGLAGQPVSQIEARGDGSRGQPDRTRCPAKVTPPLLVTTADHPLLRPEIIRHFLAGARASGADLCVGFARRAAIEAAFPGTRRTYLPIGARDLSGCNLFYLANARAVHALRLWQAVETERKHPWRMARRLGLGISPAALSGAPVRGAGI